MLCQKAGTGEEHDRTMTVRPFTIDVPDAILSRIQARLADMRIGYAPDGGGWQWGTDADYLSEFITYWRDQYDWRAQEAMLNAYPQFTVEVEGVDIHFYHVKGDGSRVIPIMLTQGWPGSVVEFLDVIPKLTAAARSATSARMISLSWTARPIIEMDVFGSKATSSKPGPMYSLAELMVDSPPHATSLSKYVGRKSIDSTRLSPPRQYAAENDRATG
jgi:hypothetical protein